MVEVGAHFDEAGHVHRLRDAPKAQWWRDHRMAVMT
jgi:hypothetical protein